MRRREKLSSLALVSVCDTEFQTERTRRLLSFRCQHRSKSFGIRLTPIYEQATRNNRLAFRSYLNADCDLQISHVPVAETLLSDA